MATPRSTAVRLGPRVGDSVGTSKSLEDLFARTRAARGSVPAALELAREVGRSAPLPGSGATAELWEKLATIAAADVQAARVIEPHLDALTILAEAAASGVDTDLAALSVDETSTWGVFAAEGAGTRLDALESSAGIRLAGVKPWCSLASSLSHALVTAHTITGDRALFAVGLRQPGVTSHDELWVARGMPQVPSGPVEFDDVTAVRIGADGWYLNRPGFWWGGLGVAAIWWGGAVGIARAMLAAASDSATREPDQAALAHLGAVDARLDATRAVLAEAAQRIDAGTLDDSRLLAARGRCIAADAAEVALIRSSRSLGPAPFARDDDFAGQHADLALYVRQHHAERDDAALGRLIVEAREREDSTSW